ncbi:MAG TPA: ATP-binding protein [Candidatus Cloacimonadota bacterium]|nr:ATP-binding protein [Candidatus Cloacimonadota bacterium]
MINYKSNDLSLVEQENDILKTKLRQLQNELKMTQLEFNETNQKYLEIVNQLEQKVIKKNEQLYHSQELIKQKNDELQMMLDYAPALIFFKSAELVYNQVNHKFLSFFKISPSDIINKKNTDLPDHLKLFSETHDRQVLQQKKALYQMIECVQINDDTYYFSVDRVPIADSKGNVPGLICFAKDVTEINAIEQEKSLLQSQLRQAQKIESLGTLASGIAHDFNNILAAIIGYAEMASNIEGDDFSKKKYMDEVLKASLRAKELIRQILTFSRKTETSFKPVDLVAVIEEVNNFLRPTLPSSIDLVFNNNSDHAVILGDHTQIHQVFMNLCTNAYQSMKSKKGKLIIDIIKTKIKEDDSLTTLSPGHYYKISIKDNGVGINPDNLDKIFEPYFTTKKSGEGTGLGLSVVLGIVNTHKGTIRVKSELDKGPEFSVYLPKLEFHELDKCSVPVNYIKGNQKILLVDDEKSIASLITEFLCYLGYTVVSTSDSQEAWDLFQDAPDSYHLLMTDMTMPKMTGIELIEKVRILRPEIPVVLSSGYQETIEEERINDLKNLKILQKPYELYHISSLLNEIFQSVLSE